MYVAALQSDETAGLYVVYETKMVNVAALQKLKLQVCMLCMRLKWCMWLGGCPPEAETAGLYVCRRIRWCMWLLSRN